MSEQVAKQAEPKTVAELFGTEDFEEQKRIVGGLVQSAQAPIVTMTAVLDGRTGKIDVLMNGNYSFDDVYGFLDLVRKDIVRREREALLKKEQPAE